MNLLEEARLLQPELIELRHYLHAYPELGHDLPITTARVCEELTALGIPYESVENGGILATLGKAGGKRILLRADMDALPIQEETELPYASKLEGQMHACGHDVHTTMLLGAAKLLKAHESELSGEVILCFQQAEELMDGAHYIVESDLLKPMPDHAFSMHVFPSETAPSGTFTCTAGTFMTSLDLLHITVTGKAAHGSAPHKGVNAIVAAAHIIQAITDVLRYEVDPQHPSVLTVCQIQGGTADNIIPESCTFGGTLRTVSEEARNHIKKRLHEIAAGAELTYRVKVDIDATGMSRVHNDPDFVKQVHDWIAATEGQIVEDVGSHLNMASEDFSEFGLRIPSAMLEILSLSPEGKHYPGHNSHVLFDDEVLYRGVAAYTQVALQYLR